MFKTVLVTGANGFIGRNLVVSLRQQEGISLLCFDANDPETVLFDYLKEAEVIFHLAGVNRPDDPKEFERVNSGMTDKMLSFLEKNNLKPLVVFASSIQAELENPYGISKKQAEDSLISFSKRTDTPVKILRLENVFGKWCRPNYNSVVATFCYNIANNIPILINNPETTLNLIYVDDIVKKFISLINKEVDPSSLFDKIQPLFSINLRELSSLLYSFKEMRQSLVLPELSDLFIKRLYSTYLSYLPENEFSYIVKTNQDQRGSLTELLKSNSMGQVFISTTKPGITRGNHFHNSKVEKFCVVKGSAVISFRHIEKGEIIKYSVCGEKIEMVDIPPGYTHNIENVGEDELITLFWANEMFSSENPDTFFMKV